MTDSPFQALIREREARQPLGTAAKAAVPEDDAARPDGYEAVRRIRSYHFADVIFRSHRGAAQAFPWSHLRSWLRDDGGQRMSFVWPEAVVVLTGRHLDRFEEDVMRRIVAEFRQVTPGDGGSLLPGVPVIVTMEISTLDMAEASS